MKSDVRRWMVLALSLFVVGLLAACGGGDGEVGGNVAGIWRSQSATNAQGRTIDPVVQFFEEDAAAIAYFSWIFDADGLWSLGLRGVAGDYVEVSLGTYTFNGTDLGLRSDGGGTVSHGATVNGDSLTITYRSGALIGQTTTFEKTASREVATRAASTGLTNALRKHLAVQ